MAQEVLRDAGIESHDLLCQFDVEVVHRRSEAKVPVVVNAVAGMPRHIGRLAFMACLVVVVAAGGLVRNVPGRPPGWYARYRDRPRSGGRPS